MIENDLFDEKGCIPVWGKVSTTGTPYYVFAITNEDKFVLFPQKSDNPKAPKFLIKKAKAEMRTKEE